MNDYLPEYRKAYWTRVLIVWLIAVAVIGGLLCWLLFQYSKVYEETKPELAMERLMQNTGAEEWFNSALSSANEYVSAFDDGEALFTKYYNDNFPSPELAYRKVINESGSEKSVFIITANGTDLYKVILTATDQNHYFFGRHDWVLNEVKVCNYTTHLEYYTVVVYQDKAGQILINSKPVDARYYTESVPFLDIDPIELQFKQVPKTGKFVIEKMFGEFSATELTGRTYMAGDVLQYETEPIYPEYDEAGRTCSYHQQNQVYSVEICAPDDVTVYLSDVEIPDEYKSDVVFDVFKGFEDYVGENGWTRNTYRLEGLHAEPHVTAVDKNGKYLEAVTLSSGTILFFHNNDKLLELEIKKYADQFFDAYMNYVSNSYNYQYQKVLSQKTYQKSELYNYFSKSNTGMAKAPKTAASYSVKDIGHFERLSQDCFVCSVVIDGSFKAKMKEYSKEYSFDACYEILFIKDKGSWVACSMSKIS